MKNPQFIDPCFLQKCPWNPAFYPIKLCFQTSISRKNWDGLGFGELSVTWNWFQNHRIIPTKIMTCCLKSSEIYWNPLCFSPCLNLQLLPKEFRPLRRGLVAELRPWRPGQWFLGRKHGKKRRKICKFFGKWIEMDGIDGLSMVRQNMGVHQLKNDEVRGWSNQRFILVHWKMDWKWGLKVS